MKTAVLRLPGHPDQACDLVAEAIVDEYVRRDPTSRLRIAVMGGRGALFVSGDILSEADFDVSAHVKRTLASLGVTDDLEPFVSLEAVPSDRVAAIRLSPEAPVTVTGYATAETEEGVPMCVALARRLAERLNDKRLHDPNWFWLGPDCDIVAISGKETRLIVTAEHGEEPLDVVRQAVTQEALELQPSSQPNLRVEVNPLGGRVRRGLANAFGASGRGPSPYGSFLPALPSFIGRDPQSAEKAGAWLMRALARRLVREGAAQSALVQAVYLPGDMKPHAVTARDEKGRDITARAKPEELSLARVMSEWWRPELNLEATQYGLAGSSQLPWEKRP